MAQRVMGNTCRHKTARQLRCSLKKLPLCDVFQGILLKRKRGFKTFRTVLALLIGRKEGREHFKPIRTERRSNISVEEEQRQNQHKPDQWALARPLHRGRGTVCLTFMLFQCVLSSAQRFYACARMRKNKFGAIARSYVTQ